MQVLTLQTGSVAADDFRGTVLCQTVTQTVAGKAIAFRKGHVVTDDDVALLRSIEPREVRVYRIEAGDVHEEEAGLRIAQALRGPGLDIRGPIQSRYNLVASERGIVVVDTVALREVNLVSDVSVFTAMPLQPVSAGDAVAGAKVVPIVTREDSVAAVERIAASRGPIVQVQRFLPRRIGVVSKQRPSPALWTRFEGILHKKMDWFGSTIELIRYTSPDLASVKDGLREALAAKVDVIITAGSSSADPIDSLVVGVEELGGTIVARGAPAHPGSFFWLGYLDGRPVFGMPSCGAYSEATVVDLLLPRVMAGQRITREDIADLGAGGLFDRGMSARFPAYGLDADLGAD